MTAKESVGYKQCHAFVVISEVSNGNYEQADQHAVSAYLDNYEYLEAPIEKHYPDLMLTIEEEMREELRTKKRMKKC